MKKRFCSIPAKTACFLTCVISFCIFIVSVIGAMGLAVEGFYQKSEGYLLEDALYGTISNDAYTLVRYALYPETKLYTTHEFNVESTNLRYRIVDSEWNVLKTNLDDASGEEWKYNFTFSKSEYIENLGVGVIPGEGHYIFQADLEDGLPINDDYAIHAKFVSIGCGIKYWIFPIGVFSLVLSVVLFVLLMCASGRRPNSDEIRGGALNSVPFDLVFGIAVLVIGAYLLIVDELFYGAIAEAIAIGGFVLLVVPLFIGLSMSFAARIKQKTLINNTVIVKFAKLSARFLKFTVRKIKSFVLSLPLIWKTVVIAALIVLIDIVVVTTISYGNDNGFGSFLFFLKNAVIVIVLICSALYLRKLQKGAENLAKGDFESKIDTDKMFWDLKQHGEYLNSISDGMSIAVEKRLKSERTKTELITNVSHDIKTPLTSIINYATLISESECDSDQHKEYSEVLVRKSKHLKRLLDDIVEMSKATSGNLEVSLSKCDSNVLISQLTGEFDEMCERAGLELIVKQPEKPIFIMADSRRIWRIFENLMSNACKYSLGNSRVYVSLEEKDGFASFVFRNTSKIALDITPDELTERFVRGDKSRTTEGNGLGLSIAKSLTELQNGKMDVSIDGDLFKVILNFPIIK